MQHVGAKPTEEPYGPPDQAGIVMLAGRGAVHRYPAVVETSGVGPRTQERDVYLVPMPGLRVGEEHELPLRPTALERRNQMKDPPALGERIHGSGTGNGTRGFLCTARATKLTAAQAIPSLSRSRTRLLGD